MNPGLYALTGLALFVLGLHGLFVRPALLHKLVAGNIAASGVFLVIARSAAGPPDPVAQALVLTGIVVAVAVTAYAAALLARLVRTTGRARLDDDGE